MRGLILALALFATAPADAAERHWPVGSVTRLRVDAPVAVRVVTGGGTGVRVTATDRATIDRLEVRADGDTLTIRAHGGAALSGEVFVATPRLESVALSAPATVMVDAMRAERVTTLVAGAGTLTVARLDANALAATLSGEGAMTLGGRAREARLIANGPATIDATRVTVDQLSVQATGDSIVRAAARYTAQISAGRDAQVMIAGTPQCTVRAAAPAAVTCGKR